MRGFTQRLAKLPGPEVDAFYFRIGPALGEAERVAQRELRGELLLDTSRRIRERLEQGRGGVRVRDRFRVSRALHCLLSGTLEVVHSLFDVSVL